MTPVEVEAKVRSILSGKLDAAPDKVVLSARLVEDLGMDSFKAIEMVFELEDVFNLKIPDEDIASAVRVQDIVDYILKKVKP